MCHIKVWAGLAPLKALGQEPPPSLLQHLATSLGSLSIFISVLCVPSLLSLRRALVTEQRAHSGNPNDLMSRNLCKDLIFQSTSRLEEKGSNACTYLSGGPPFTPLQGSPS